GLTFKKWGKRFNTFLHYVEILISPDLIILGGGTAKHFDAYKEYLTIQAPVVPAHLGNFAGIIGAAAAALHQAPID
ncbi:MAG: ROK family protein, partial [Bacteroidia bacterium]|nr:ROK family protein [Bacteroidia bacterium]